MNYSADDSKRYVDEFHSSQRSPFARDKARIIHSSAWRRLAAKTQVLSPTSTNDFARNRLTHSLEVAQIGSELAVAFGLDQNVVEAACLAHDLGHPPFGHNGEKALNEWISDFGGFEGNAQTLRILTRLEPKRFTLDGLSVGLNLTRATLDASCKYPWGLGQGPIASSPKFGFFEDDYPIFEWLRLGAPKHKKSAEAQVMDLADDIAYSVHDFEDAILNGFIDPELLIAKSGHDKLIEKITLWAANEFTPITLERAFERIAKTKTWLTTWSGSLQDEAQLKNFTSDMIGRFARGAIESTKQQTQHQSIARYLSDISVPDWVKEEIAVLKGIVAAYVMNHGGRQPIYSRERELLTELLENLWQSAPHSLDRQFQEAFANAQTEAAARRVVVDQVASLTDQDAITWRACFAGSREL